MITRRDDLQLSRSGETELEIADIVRPLSARPRTPTVTVEVRTRDGQAQLVAPVSAIADAELPGSLVALLPAITGTTEPAVQLVLRFVLPSGASRTDGYVVPVGP